MHSMADVQKKRNSIMIMMLIVIKSKSFKLDYITGLGICIVM